MPSGPGLKGLYNAMPNAYDVVPAVNGGTARYSLSTKGLVNRVRIKVRVTNSGSVGSGTSTVSLMVKKFTMWPGTRSEVEQQKRDPCILIENSQILQAIVFSKARINSTSRGAYQSQNETMAGNATYEGTFDLIVNLSKGDYYAACELETAANMAGYSTKPTSVTVEFAVAAIDEGIPIAESEVMKVAQVASVTSIEAGVIREFMLYHASAAQELNMSSIQFGEVYSTVGLELLAEEGLVRTGGSSVTTIYKSSHTRENLKASFSTTLTVTLGTIN